MGDRRECLDVAAGDARFLLDARIVRVSRAQPPPDVPDVAILIGRCGEFSRAPSGSESGLLDSEARATSEARALACALRSALSAGVLDRLLAELLRQKSSQLVVPWGADPFPSGVRDDR